MLYIKKIQPLPDIIEHVNVIKHSTEWKETLDHDTNAIRKQFDLLPKSSIRRTLLKEQKGLCAYCMKRIHDDNSTTIEHWLPLSKNKDYALQYSNMLATCHGGRKTETEKQRVLCCDASKAEEEIKLCPWNEAHMRDIAYMSNGIMYTISGDKEFEKDINEILCLNGLKDAKGNLLDTSTEIVKGRRDAIQWCNDFYRVLDRQGKCTSLMIKKKIDELEHAEQMVEFAGVKLFFLKRKHRELLKRGK